jgi:hypothetical protein
MQASATYPAQMRQEIGALYNCMKIAGPAYALSPATVNKIYFDNARSMLSKAAPPKITGLTQAQARKFMKDLFTTQWKENVLIAGEPAAPALNDFLPKDLQSA